jgi:hypothetical protein
LKESKGQVLAGDAAVEAQAGFVRDEAEFELAEEALARANLVAAVAFAALWGKKRDYFHTDCWSSV